MTKLYGISVYYGGGFQSFGDNLVASIMFSGYFFADLASETAAEDFQDEFEGYSEELIEQLQDNPAAIAHEISDAAYCVGVDQDQVLETIAREIFNQPENGIKFIEWVKAGNTGDFRCVDHYDDSANDNDEDVSLLEDRSFLASV